jgi:uncharacterized membrane protein YwzB
MKNLGKIAGINLIGVLVYSSVIRIVFWSDSSQDRSMDILISSAVAVGIHVIICFLVSVIGFVTSNNETGRNWLATTGIMLLVGFSVCLGNAAL